MYTKGSCIGPRSGLTRAQRTHEDSAGSRGGKGFSVDPYGVLRTHVDSADSREGVGHTDSGDDAWPTVEFNEDPISSISGSSRVPCALLRELPIYVGYAKKGGVSGRTDAIVSARTILQ